MNTQRTVLVTILGIAAAIACGISWTDRSSVSDFVSDTDGSLDSMPTADSNETPLANVAGPRSSGSEEKPASSSVTADATSNSLENEQHAAYERPVAQDQNASAKCGEDEFCSSQNLAEDIDIGDKFCDADVDGSNSVDIQDLLCFVSEWFDGSPQSLEMIDLNDSGKPDAEDFVIFLQHWTSGC